MDKINILKRVGDISQICDAKRVRAIGGLDDGVIYINVYTGSGLNFSITESRGLDISFASYKGKTISFTTKNKVTSPYLFEETNNGFRRSFYAGLLTTCGMTYNGSASTYKGTYLGTHGRFSNTPAENVSISKEWLNDEYIISITGYIKETKLFGENLLLKRTITTKMYSDKISINDSVINQSFSPQPLMMLYHINCGYPLLNIDSKFTKSESNIKPRDDEAKKNIDLYDQFNNPIHDFKEQVFYHEDFLNESAYGQIFNSKLNLGLRVQFNTKQLPILLEWKMIGEGDYVVGIEPSTNYPEGFVDEHKKRKVYFLKPFETKKFDIDIILLNKE